MFKRTPDIFLSPKQLEQRAAAPHDQANFPRPVRVRDRVMIDAKRDQAMADMKRLVREGERRRT